MLTGHAYAEALRAEIARGEAARMKKRVPVDELLGEFDEHFRRLRRLADSFARDAVAPERSGPFQPGAVVVGRRLVAVERRKPGVPGLRDSKGDLGQARDRARRAA